MSQYNAVCRLETEGHIVQVTHDECNYIGPHNLAKAIAKAIKGFDSLYQGYDLVAEVIVQLQKEQKSCPESAS